MNVKIRYEIYLKNNKIIDGYINSKIGTSLDDFKIMVL